jgi:hypothetical protein
MATVYNTGHESTRSLVVTYCQTIGKADPDSKINEAPHA